MQMDSNLDPKTQDRSTLKGMIFEWVCWGLLGMVGGLLWCFVVLVVFWGLPKFLLAIMFCHFWFVLL